jgi:hypothetical protein
MHDVLDTGSGGKTWPQRSQQCEYCGGSIDPQDVFDRRGGKGFQLHRCVSCEKLCWVEDE